MLHKLLLIMLPMTLAYAAAEAEELPDEIVDDSVMSHNKIVGLNEKALKSGDGTPTIDPAQPTLFGMRFCPWCERVLLVAARKGINLRMININLKDKPEWYKLKHPEGKVPALELDGKIVLDSAIIPEFLDDTYPQDRILPSDPFLKAQQKMLASKLETILPKAFNLLLDVMRHPDVGEKNQKEARTLLTQAEKILEQSGAFYGGDKPGFADYLTIPFLERIFVLSHKEGITGFNTDDFPGNQEYPSLTRWFYSMTQLPEFAAVTQPVDVQLKWFEGYVKGDGDYDTGL